MVEYAGSTPPNGFLACDGSTIVQSDYPELYAIIGGTLPSKSGYIIKAKQVAVPFDVAEYVRPVVYHITSNSNSVTIPNLNEYAEIEIILHLSNRTTEFNGVHRLYNGVTAFRTDSDASSYIGSVNWNTGIIEVASNFNVKEVICYKASQLNIIEI